MISRLVLLGCTLLCFVGFSHAQTYAFHATVDRDSLTVGDPFHLTLSLELPTEAPQAVIPDIGLPEALRVLGAPDAEQAPAGPGRQRWVQTIRLTSFRPGESVIEDLRLRVVQAPGDTVVLSDDPITILVQSVKPDDLKDILDVKSPVSLQAVIPVWVWVVLGLIVLLVAAIVYQKRKSRDDDSAPAAVVVDWFEEVRRLMASDLVQLGDYKTYYSGLSESLRRYIEQAAGVEAMERTTFEIRGDLGTAEVDATLILSIEGFLTEADLVKFAKFEPGSDRARSDGERVLELMESLRPEVSHEPEEEVAPA